MIDEFQKNMNKIYATEIQKFIINKAKQIASDKDELDIYKAIGNVIQKFSILFISNEYREDFFNLLANAIALGMKKK
ncbi:hypothetical protein ES705_13812 [subsurface metagenome]